MIIYHFQWTAPRWAGVSLFVKKLCFSNMAECTIEVDKHWLTEDGFAVIKCSNRPQLDHIKRQLAAAVDNYNHGDTTK